MTDPAGEKGTLRSRLEGATSGWHYDGFRYRDIAREAIALLDENERLRRDNESMWNAMQRACNKPEAWNETLTAALDACRTYGADCG